ncbi:MAG TPA: sugar phosphate nucleotidyltransferase [Candidatus Limnocylindrales bacterium]|nr:sugar phosphate nucleotidyltransferase [Candidatus Limnocylindrales bacterium]
MQAVVMAGGEGSRLRPLTINRPKPMVSVVNKPCLGHIFDLLKRHGITDAYVTLQYLASVIQDAYGDGGAVGMRLRYSVEETPLGTGGSVRQIGDALDDTFLVISGDALTDIDLSRVIASHRETGAAVTITLVHVKDPLEYGVVITAPDGRITKFLEKPSWGEVFSDTINTGIYVMEPRVLERYAVGEVFDFSKDLFPKLLAEGEPLYGHVATAYWTDVGSIAEYARASADLLQGKVRAEPLGAEIAAGVFAGGDVEIDPSARLQGPIYLGRGVKVGPEADIVGPAVLRDYVVVDRGALVDRSIVWRNSYVGERAELHGTLVGRQCALKARVILEEGSVIGDHSVVNEGARVRAQVKIWPDKQIEAGAVVNSSLIWGAQGRRALFGRFGVTGLVNVDLTPEFAARLGAAFASTLPQGATVTVNRDQHRSSRMLKRAIMGGVVGGGVAVADVGQAPLPIGRFHTRRIGAAGGIHIRVSPFDNRVCDVKFMDGQALDMGKAQERKVENVFFREDFRRVTFDDVGQIYDSPRVGEAYSEAFLAEVARKREIAAAKFKIVVNYSHGTGAQFLPQLLSSLDVDVVALNAVVSENVGSRSLEEFEEEKRELAAITATLRASFGVIIDAGGEKVFLVDDRGRVADDRHFVTAFCWLAARTTPGVVAVPVFAPAAIERLVVAAGGRVQRVRASAEAQMHYAARENPLLVADGLGGFIFPRFHPSFDGLFAVVKLLELLAAAGTTLSELMDETPTAHMARLKVACPWEEKGRVMRMLAQEPATERTRQVDGVKHVYDGEWVLVLPDADQPLFNVWAEARDDGRAWALAHEYADRVGTLRSG